MTRNPRGAWRCDPRRLQRAIALPVLLVLTFSAQAQNVLTVAGEANGGGTSTVLRVKLPLVGWVTVPVTQSPIARAEIPIHGGSDDEDVASAGVPLGSLSVLSLSGVENTVLGTPDGAVAAGFAEARVSRAALLGGLVEVESLVSVISANGQIVGGTTTAALDGSTYVQRVKVGGAVLFQSEEIPANTVVPINANVQISILGLTLSLPLSGSLTLNEQLPLTSRGIEVNAARLVATASVPNVAELAVDVVLAGPSVQIDETEPDVDQLCLNRPQDEYFRLGTEGDCRGVVRCGVNADGVVRLAAVVCPSGLAFDVQRQTCDWKVNVRNCDVIGRQTLLRPAGM